MTGAPQPEGSPGHPARSRDPGSQPGHESRAPRDGTSGVGSLVGHIRAAVERRRRAVTTDIDSLIQRSGRLAVDDIDFGAFRQHPLDADTLRCLRYMHDVEGHTACYLRDLLATRAHRDPEVTAFLACWCYEEHWHGEALAEVLRAHGEPAGRSRLAASRGRLPRRDALRPVAFTLASALTPHIVAVHMTWGAVNEWATQAGYGRLAAKAQHPVLSELLRRIMRQEGRHIDFYASGHDAGSPTAPRHGASRASPSAATGHPSAPASCPTLSSGFSCHTSSPTSRAEPRRNASTAWWAGSRASRDFTWPSRRWTTSPARPRRTSLNWLRSNDPHKKTDRKRSNVMLAEIFGLDGVVVLIVVVAVLFGGTQIPKLARSLGSARSEFKKGLEEVHGSSVDTDAGATTQSGGGA